MDYDKHIIRILSDVGQGGITVKRLAMHVYNMSCNMFDMPQFDDVYAYVRAYVARQSRTAHGTVQHTGRWGYYRLNRSNAKVRQMLIDFDGTANDNDGNNTNQPQSKAANIVQPGLFD